VAASVCLCRKQERSLRCRPIVPLSPMVGLWISHTRSAVGDCMPCRVPSLHFDACTMAPDTRPLLAILRSHLPAMSTDCPVASDGEGGRFPAPVVRVPIRHCASPVAPHGCFVTFWACHRSLWEWHLRPASYPLPLRAPAGDLTPITSVKGTYSGEIKSLDRDPGIASLNPGMQFPGN